MIVFIKKVYTATLIIIIQAPWLVNTITEK